MRTNGQPERRVSFFSSFLSASFCLLYLWKEEFLDQFLNFENKPDWACSLKFVVIVFLVGYVWAPLEFGLHVDG